MCLPLKELTRVSGEFLGLSLQQLVDIIENDHLNVKQEDVVFEAILCWIAHSPWDHKAHISVLLPKQNYNCIGGWSEGRPTNAIEAYHSRADHWVNLTEDEEGPQAHRGVVSLNSFVYCIGGTDGVGRLNTVRRFDPITRTWHHVAPMHYRRCYLSVAVLNGCIYDMGGF
ncbi:kelch-like protein 10 [Polymixia lowei]